MSWEYFSIVISVLWTHIRRRIIYLSVKINLTMYNVFSNRVIKLSSHERKVPNLSKKK